MPEINDYTAQVLKRTKLARKEAGFRTQADIAEAMGIDRARYAKYETERIVHKQLIAKFCELTEITETWLLTGEGPKDGGGDKIDAILSEVDDHELRERIRDQVASYTRGLVDAQK